MDAFERRLFRWYGWFALAMFLRALFIDVCMKCDVDVKENNAHRETIEFFASVLDGVDSFFRRLFHTEEEFERHIRSKAVVLHDDPKLNKVPVWQYRQIWIFLNVPGHRQWWSYQVAPPFVEAFFKKHA